MDGKVIVVTGAGQGLGRAYARRLCADGGRVVVADVNIDRGERVVADIVADGGQASFRQVDVGDPRSCSDFAAYVRDTFGALHGLVNNAAIFSSLTMKPFWEITVEEWDRLMTVNLRGPFLLTAALLPSLRAASAASDACVVHVASDVVWTGRPNYLHYVASKGGVIAMTYAMARELGEYGIRVNAISPGPTYTEVPRATVSPAQRDAARASQALHRDAEPDDMAGVVAFLLSEDAKFVTGQCLSVNGGLVTR